MIGESICVTFNEDSLPNISNTTLVQLKSIDDDMKSLVTLIPII